MVNELRQEMERLAKERKDEMMSRLRTAPQSEVSLLKIIAEELIKIEYHLNRSSKL